MKKIEHIVFDSTENTHTARSNPNSKGIVQHYVDGMLYVCSGSAISDNDGLPYDWNTLDVWRVDPMGGRFSNTGFAEYVTDPQEWLNVGVSLIAAMRNSIR